MYADMCGISICCMCGPKRAISRGRLWKNHNFRRFKNCGRQIRIEIIAIATRCRLRGIIACFNRTNLTLGQPVLVEISRILLINLPVVYAAQFQERGKIETQIITHKRKIIAGDPQIAEQTRLVSVPRRHANTRNVEIAHLHRRKAFIVVVFKRV